MIITELMIASILFALILYLLGWLISNGHNIVLRLLKIPPIPIRPPAPLTFFMCAMWMYLMAFLSADSLGRVEINTGILDISYQFGMVTLLVVLGLSVLVDLFITIPVEMVRKRLAKRAARVIDTSTTIENRGQQ